MLESSLAICASHPLKIVCWKTSFKASNPAISLPKIILPAYFLPFPESSEKLLDALLITEISKEDYTPACR